jgi:hypothetical protein
MITSGIRAQGFINGYRLLGTDGDMNELVSSVKRLYAKYRGASDFDVHKALRTIPDLLPGIRMEKAFGGQNIIVDGFYTDLMARFDGTASVSQTLEMKYIGLGTRSSPAAAETDTLLGNEANRYPYTSRYTNGVYTFVFSKQLGATDGILAGSTTVAAGTWTTTVFDCVSAASISTGDRLYVETSGSGDTTFVTVTNKATNTLTVSPALPAIPVAGDDVFRCYGEGGLFMGGAATATANTGTLVNHKNIDFYKTSEVIVLDGVLVFQRIST